MSEIIVGKYHGTYLTAKDEQFVLVAAPTGSNKSTALVIPNLLNFADSVVCLDLKLENFRTTSLYRQRHGHEIFLWAPFTEDGFSHCWNMLDAIPRNSPFRVGEVLAIAQSFYPSDCDPKEKFWNDNARNLFLALVLYLVETPELPCTLGEVLRQSSGCGRPLKEHLQQLIARRQGSRTPLSAECLNAMHRFLSTPEATLGNVITTLTAPLLVFANPVVDAATARSDFSLADVKRKRMSIYVGIPPHRLEDAALLVNLFFSQLIDQNTRLLPESDPSCRHECLIALEEAAAVGKIKIVAKANGHIRGYKLRLLTIVQSIAQLHSLYGEADARTLMTDHAIQIAFPPREQRDADDYSKMLGTTTQKATSTGTSRTRGGGGTGTESEHTSEHARALLLPQEVKTLAQHRQIIFAEYTPPILCDKARYYEDHRFLDRLKEVSPALARLDDGPRGRIMRTLGLTRWAKVRPSEQQIKHAAFVLGEMSAAIPPLQLAPPPPPPAASPPAPATTPVKIRLTPIDIETPGRRAPSSLPVFADPDFPTLQEAQAIVDAFFGPLDAQDHADTPASPPAKRRKRRTTPDSGDRFAHGAAQPNSIEDAGKPAAPASGTKTALPAAGKTGQLDLSFLDQHHDEQRRTP
jgi:type IV secretion system protein VirD4